MTTPAAPVPATGGTTPPTAGDQPPPRHRPEISTVLVANRGEIARRVFASCRRLGLGTVAIFSDADADSAHVAEADVAVRLPGNAAVQTYLRTELIIDAAHRGGADAIHPGYGFLSENPGFARAVADAGLTWIGPSPEAIEAMGSKIEAKKLMAAAGVPMLADLAPEQITDADLPVLVKASAGGGGRGMRIVRDLIDLPGALAAARTEAATAFGDGTVFCERYLPAGRHIEVQIIADAHGTAWTLGERECSIQRRHQKIIEETPSPLVARMDGMRDRLFTAARAAATAIGYTGAGTVEFLADTGGDFFFLEMNTRLQVEHPVTEAVTGTDLVALQLHVATGGRLKPEPPAAQGHSIEARLYAEDPANDWAPQSGTLHRLRIPGVDTEFGVGARPAGLRLDSGVHDGATVGIHYDPLLAKVISWAPTREHAARLLAGALNRAQIHGLRTNRELLVNVLRHPAFRAGETDTAFLDRHGLHALAAAPADTEAEALCALAATLGIDAATRAQAPVLGRLPSGWRNVVSAPQLCELNGPRTRHSIRYRLTRTGLVAEGFDVTLVQATPQLVILEDAGLLRTFRIAHYGDSVEVDYPGGSARFTRMPRFRDPAEHIAPGSLLAPMPGTVVRIAAGVGDDLRAGQPVLWLEAMKMQHEITAPADGVVAELNVSVGQQVDVGAVLARVEAGAAQTGQE